ncbi:Protein kinase-like (PK-like) [Glarea lozoyensis ATCC 20868]|uniref:Protein kinase-like (PK-like) n=1 Tax=Glarea lozoyensis (strain ATCC 20868 / MF5171) TaxID=1116229 RepID=S3CPB7_GLAL2|nr:Protein kinase-like (PK-like) [Glarea lozoyensis ATCC 20868]EPE27555.1 Protein kinase-like (PK-like) [Glarea lozoyensis ATCC 20868]
MVPSWLPSILRPDCVWKPRRNLTPSSTIPPTPSPNPQFVQRFWGHIHTYLRNFSQHYCRWLGVQFDNQIIPLPFGLLLKWSDGTRLEEVLTTKVCYAAGLPTPYIISYGSHPDTPHAPISILMTRLPGRELGQIYESLSSEAKATALSEFKFYISSIRKWKSPWGPSRICSLTEGPIRSIRVPNHIVGPCETSQDFHDHLLSPAYNSFGSEEVFNSKLQLAKKLQTLQAKRPGIKFTHGDIKHHNFLVDDIGHITGILDWEAARWYPVFWEWTTAMRFVPQDFWWFDFLIESGAGEYREESECERALTSLTVDSYSW